MRILFVSIWFYYAPFIALLMNFMAPVIFKEDVVVVTDGSSMDDDYQEWLTEQISQANSDYEEPSVEEMI